MSNIEKKNKDNSQKLLELAADQWVELVLQQILHSKKFPKTYQFPLRERGVSYGRTTK